MMCSRKGVLEGDSFTLALNVMFYMLPLSRFLSFYAAALKSRIQLHWDAPVFLLNELDWILSFFQTSQNRFLYNHKDKEHTQEPI